MSLERKQGAHRLVLACALVLAVGLVHGLDVAMIVALSLGAMEIEAHLPEKESPMLLPLARPDLSRPVGAKNPAARRGEVAAGTLRRSYRDAVRLAAREEILADLAEDAVTARLHADTARFHHGSAHAYAKALDLLLGEPVSVSDDKQTVKATTRETDLAPMRCQSRRYRTFDPHRP